MAVATIPHPPLYESERLVVLPGKGGPIVKAIVAAEEVGEALGTARIILIRSYQEFPVGGVLIGRWSASADSTQRLIEMLLIFHSNSLGPVTCHIPLSKTNELQKLESETFVLPVASFLEASKI